MNLNQFLRRVDSLTEKLSKEELADVIRRLGNIWPESERQKFLGYLENSRERAAEPDQDIRRTLEEVEQKLDLIEEEELCLDSEMNEEYDDWYNSEEDEFYFHDPEHVTEAVEDAFGMVHRLMDCEMYEEAYELSKRLMELQVRVDGDYGDYAAPYMNWKELESENLISIPNDRFLREMMYAAYRILPLKERIPALFRIMKEGMGSEASLETVLQAGGGRLPQLEEFLEEWTEYLGEQDGKLAGNLLKEALEFQGNSGKSLKAAGRFADKHPELYEEILQKGKEKGRDEEMLQIGLQALQTIRPDYEARSRIALQTAEYALSMGNQETAEFCWLEAFRSYPNLVNFLRLMRESRDFEPYREKVREIYLECRRSSSSGSMSMADYDKPGKRNLTSNTYFALEFFSGHFDEVISEGMDTSEALGWSFTFMKEGIALFLLTLNQGERLLAGCQAMCEKITGSFSFDSEKYSEGLLRPADPDSNRLFMECLNQWKKGLSLSQDQQDKMMKRLEKWIEKRVEGIMGANRRNYYGECAALIAALGEVKESRGELNGKEKLMEAYKDAYSRRRAFHEELRRFGMIDTRKSAVSKS